MARSLFWLTVLAGLVATVIAWFVLPDRVPLHFGASGEPDRWGSRTEAVATMGAVIAGMALLFWALVHWVPKLPGSLLNLPMADKRWWLASPDRRRELDRRLTTDLHLVGAATLLLVVAVEVLTMVGARSEDQSLGTSFWVVLAVYLVALLAYTGFMIAVRYRTPRDETRD